MSKAETHIVHFTVEGEFITDTARRLWNEEDEPVRALRILECITGLTQAQMMDIIEGRSKLVGDSSEGMRLEPDKAECKSLQETIRKLKEERDEARDEAADLTQMVIGGDEATTVLPSPTGLRRVPRRKTRLHHGKGSSRTALKEEYEFDDVLKDPEAPVVRGRGTKPLKIWQQVSLPPGPRKPKAPLTEEVERMRTPPPGEDKITHDTGWLSPEGKFYRCGYAQHARVAYDLSLTEHPDNHFVKPEGWVRLGITDDRQYFFEDEVVAPTEAQRQLIRDYCKEQGIEEPWWMREKEP